MHSCWSPVPKCRPSFQNLADQLEGLCTGFSSASVKEQLLYVNLENDEGEPDSGISLGACNSRADEQTWGVPWQYASKEDDKDWLISSSGAAHDIGGDYRYIVGPCGLIDGESRPFEDNTPEDIRDDDDIINV